MQIPCTICHRREAQEEVGRAEASEVKGRGGYWSIKGRRGTQKKMGTTENKDGGRRGSSIRESGCETDGPLDQGSPSG